MDWGPPYLICRNLCMHIFGIYWILLTSWLGNGWKWTMGLLPRKREEDEEDEEEEEQPPTTVQFCILPYNRKARIDRIEYRPDSRWLTANKIAWSHLIGTNITAWGRLRTSKAVGCLMYLDVFVVKKHQCFFPRNLYKHIQLRKAHPWHSAYSICWMSRVLSNQTLPFLVSCCIVFALTSKGFDGAVVDESDLKLQMTGAVMERHEAWCDWR